MEGTPEQRRMLLLSNMRRLKQAYSEGEIEDSVAYEVTATVEIRCTGNRFIATITNNANAECELGSMGFLYDRELDRWERET
jgi:hypothetical protein